MIKNDQEIIYKQKIAILNKMALALDKQFTEEQLLVYLEFLDAYSVQQLTCAIKKIIISYKYNTLPKIADIIDIIHMEEVKSIDREQIIETMAEAEWIKLRNDIRRLGKYRQPDFHATTAKVIDNFGGWWCVCNWYTYEMEWRHRDFIRLWHEFYGKENFLDGGADAVLQAALPQNTSAIIACDHFNCIDKK